MQQLLQGCISHFSYGSCLKKGTSARKKKLLEQGRRSSSEKSEFLSLSLCDLLLQELVDVYVEYPFFVRGCGWSSCSPQRTARLCGLQCRQLSVGDVCLALTPVAAPRLPSQPEEGSRKSAQEQEPPVDPGLEQPIGRQKRTTRRRHQSAP